MARRTKRRTGRKSRRSTKRSIKRELERSLRKTIERSIKKSLKKFNKRIKKHKKKKTKKKIQSGGSVSGSDNQLGETQLPLDSTPDSAEAGVEEQKEKASSCLASQDDITQINVKVDQLKAERDKIIEEYNDFKENADKGMQELNEQIRQLTEQGEQNTEKVSALEAELEATRKMMDGREKEVLERTRQVEGNISYLTGLLENNIKDRLCSLLGEVRLHKTSRDSQPADTISEELLTRLKLTDNTLTYSYVITLLALLCLAVGSMSSDGVINILVSENIGTSQKVREIAIHIINDPKNDLGYFISYKILNTEFIDGIINIMETNLEDFLKQLDGKWEKALQERTIPVEVEALEYTTQLQPSATGQVTSTPARKATAVKPATVTEVKPATEREAALADKHAAVAAAEAKKAAAERKAAEAREAVTVSTAATEPAAERGATATSTQPTTATAEAEEAAAKQSSIEKERETRMAAEKKAKEENLEARRAAVAKSRISPSYQPVGAGGNHSVEVGEKTRVPTNESVEEV